MKLVRRAAVLAAVLAAGCVSIRPRAGFDEVQTVVAERTGHRVHWDLGTPEDRAVAERVRALLAQELTADDAVQVALLSNVGLQATFEEIGIAQADLVQAGLLRNPVFTAEVRFPGRPRLPLEIDVTQSFLDVLVLPLRKRVAQARFEQAQRQVAHEVLDLAARTRQAFFTFQGAQQMAEMRRTVTETTGASVDAARRLREAGNITDLDLANEEAMHDRAKLDLARAEAETLDDRERLNALMGLWGTQTQWEIGSRLPELPDHEVSPEGLESLAVTQRLDLGAASREVEALSRSLGLTRRFAPLADLDVTAHVEREPEGATTMGPGVEVPLPIFDQGQAAIARGQALLRQSEARYAALAVEVRSEVRAARNRMLAARQTATYYRRVALPRHERIVDATQLQYNAMQVGVFQLLQAKQDQIDAGRESIEALRDYWLARSQLERAVGGRLLAEMGPATRPSAAPAQAGPTEQPDHQHHHGGHE